MELIAYTDQQIRTMRALLDMTEVHGLENCKNIVMMRDIIDHNQRVDVSEEEVKDGENK